MTIEEISRDEAAKAELKKYADDHGLRYFEHKWTSKDIDGNFKYYADAYLLTGIKTEQVENEEYALAWQFWSPVGKTGSYYPCTITLIKDPSRRNGIGQSANFYTSPIDGDSGKYVSRHVYPSEGKTISQLVDGIRKGMMEYHDFKKQLDTHEEKLRADGTYTADIKGHIEESGVYQVTMAQERINPKEKMCYYYEFEVSKKADSSYFCKFSCLHNEARDVFWMYNYPTFGGVSLGKKYKLVTNGTFGKKVIGSFGSCLGAIDQFLEIQSILDSAWNQIQEVKKIASRVDEYQMSDMGVLGEYCEELPKVVQVHWKDGHFNTERDVRIKFISTTGVGFADRAMVTRWVAFRYGSECTMSDGTKFVLKSDNGKYLTDGDRIRFKTQIVDWVNGRRDRCYK